ncbi:MAG: aquaporin family protein [Deltaproteobacteria bacterium]|nr:aquaporin family protein [Deltaproteobacteria bacterium]
MKIWKLYFSEFIGTALLIGIGVSFVILDFGKGSPVVSLIPSSGIRRAITGFLFGGTGMIITFSPVGKWSGAHINPVVTFSFWMKGKIKSTMAVGYVAAQFLGAAVGAFTLLFWGNIGKAIYYGATIPGKGGASEAVLGEAVTTFCLVAGLFLFLGYKRLRPFTPVLFPFLYAVMVYFEAPISGTSTNPARSFGPSLASGIWNGWWVYWIGPLLGAFVAVSIQTKWLKMLEIEVAKVYHFEHDPFKVFHI